MHQFSIICHAFLFALSARRCCQGSTWAVCAKHETSSCWPRRRSRTFSPCTTTRANHRSRSVCVPSFTFILIHSLLSFLGPSSVFIFIKVRALKWFPVGFRRISMNIEKNRIRIKYKFWFMVFWVCFFRFFIFYNFDIFNYSLILFYIFCLIWLFSP